jgi:hypothetical protein
MDGSEGCVFFGVLDLCAQRGKFSRVDLKLHIAKIAHL